MKNTLILENLNPDLLNLDLRKNCLSPQNNSCSFLQKTNIRNNDLFLNSFQDKILKSEEYQEKICSECIWYRKKLAKREL